MGTICTGVFHPYSTTGPVISSATAPPGNLETKWKQQVENAEIEPATAKGVLPALSNSPVFLLKTCTSSTLGLV